MASRKSPSGATWRDWTELLERSDSLAALDEDLAEVAGSRRGRVVLICGEAGVGKTALVRRFATEHGAARMLWGNCDALFTPRPLGPLFDVAPAAGGELEELVASGARAHEVVAALARALQAPAASVLVLEDLHWADEATLDVARLLARRVEAIPALIVATYRDDELARTHPLRIVLGELATNPAVRRLKLAALSPAAVAQLAEPYGVDSEELFRKTAGNPFFVVEVLAAGGAEVPDTVRDAVFARAARLAPPARQLLDAVSVMMPQAELWLLEAVAGQPADDLEECLTSGILTSVPAGVAFRHELARLAVEGSLAPNRRVELHRRALEALADPPGGARDLARLAYHAEAAGDADAVLRFAPGAAARAASLSAHREATAHYARALRFGDRLPAAERAQLLEDRSRECWLSGQLDEALAGRQRALAAWRDLGERRREGDSLQELARLLGFVGRSAEADQACRAAIDVLQQLEPGPELARAYAKMAQRCRNWDDAEGAIGWGRRALELAQGLDDAETVAHALAMIGAAQFLHGSPAGRRGIERSIELARGGGFEDHVAGGYLNLVWCCIRQRRFPEARGALDRGLDYCGERGLDYWWLSLLACRARCQLAAGRWSDAADTALFVLGHPRAERVARVLALTVQGLVGARRGVPGAKTALDEAVELAEATGEVQQIAPAAAARAEAAWLDGRPQDAAVTTQAALALALRCDAPWEIGELAAWRRRTGIDDAIPTAAARPYALQVAGRPSEAADLWDELGCPYDAALALADADDEELLRRAHAELQALDAAPAAAIVARRLRARGATGLPRGPRKATRQNPAELTARELEVLDLVVQGLTNAQIAGRLFLSEKTVAHHVSAILRKLDVRTRAQAGAEAVRRGFAAPSWADASSNPGRSPDAPGA